MTLSKAVWISAGLLLGLTVMGAAFERDLVHQGDRPFLAKNECHDPNTGCSYNA